MRGAIMDEAAASHSYSETFFGSKSQIELVNFPTDYGCCYF